jgi:hypothetical protein
MAKRDVQELGTADAGVVSYHINEGWNHHAQQAV